MQRLWAPLQLAWPLAKRDVLARYRGSVAGLLWALLGPLAMVAIYALVFQGVFQARWGVGETATDGFGYVVRLFAGLIELDTAARARGLRRIAVMPIPEAGLGLAINDRLTRAAAPRPGR